jgi:hypothetical protein
MKSEHQFTQALKETPTFKSFERFKQGITLKRSNVINLYDKYQQAHRYGIDYLKQNQNILANDVKMIGEVLDN